MKIINSIAMLLKKKRFIATLALTIGILSGAFVFLPDAKAATSETCINNTIDEGQCKDCCDCLDDPTERKICRDACAANDFNANSDFITVDAPQVLGPDGDYSAAVAKGSERECKTYCDESDDLYCGDRRYCRDTCNAAFSGSDNPPNPNDPADNPPAPNDPGDNNISLDQALSDEAQMKTIAFSGLAFLTGDMCSNTFFPPGKVSDFFGFQYLRDITPNGFGHNTEFAGRISDSVLSILTDAQVQALVNMANTQADQVDAYGYKRFSLIEAFLRLLENDLPGEATGLDKNALIEFTGDLYEIDADIIYTRAKVIGGIVAGLSDAQKTAFTELLNTLNTLFENAGEGGTIAPEDWPVSSRVDLSGLTAKDGRVLVSTFATQLFSWYMGSVEGDTYFCPERHGTYFGSFYMKDIPPIQASVAVTIDTNLTAEMGQAFLDALDDTQEELVTGLVDIQRTALNNIVSTRRTIAEKLRLFMTGTEVGEDEVQALVRQYGEYEGEMMYHYATNFASVGNSLTDDQKKTVMGLRTGYYEEFPDYQADSTAYDCSGAWLYASKLDTMPEIDNTDFLFGEGGDVTTDPVSVVAEGATITLIAGGFDFAEGPAADRKGNLFFSDIPAGRIYRWSEDNGLSVFREDSGGANGLVLGPEGLLLACEGERGRVVAVDPAGTVTVLAEKYRNLRFNEPNDLWFTPEGGIYFTDPVYNGSLTQDGEHVYHISPALEVTRVIDDVIRPNGIIGTGDGKTLYVTDHGAGKTYRYSAGKDGSLSDKQLFASVGGDGMTIDSEGNVYLSGDGVKVFDSIGNLMETIDVPGQTTNICFGGSDGRTLFITTVSSVYSLRMMVEGAPTPAVPEEEVDDPTSFTLKKSVSEGMLTLSWEPVDGAEGYTLLTAPMDLSVISEYPMGNRTTISAPIWETPSFYTVVQATNRFGVIEYSNLITIP